MEISVPLRNLLWVRRCAVIGRFLCLLVGIECLVVLIGWIFDAPGLTSIVPGGEPTKPEAAVGLIAASIACALISGRTAAGQHAGASRSRIEALLCWTVVAIGTLVIAEILSGRGFGIDAALKGLVAGPTERSSASVAVSLILIGAALVWLRHRNRPVWLAQVAAHLVLLNALISLSGYLYDAGALRTVPIIGTTAVPSALGLLALSAALMAARPTEGVMAAFTSAGGAGVFARRSIASIVVIPLLVNWVEFAGEVWGWYPQRTGWMLDTGLSVVILLGLTWWVASTLLAKDLSLDRLTRSLHDSEQRYRTILEMAPDPIVVKNHRRIEYANAAALKLVGASVEDVIGRSPMAFLRSGDRANVERALCGVLELGKQISLVEHYVVKLDGTEVEVEATASEIDVGGQRLSQVILRDVTKRKQHEQALRESLERFELAAKATHDAVWDLDVRTGTGWWSDLWYDKYGFSRTTVSSLAAWAERIHPDERERVSASLKRALLEPVQMWSEEYRYRMADGAYATVAHRGYIVRDATGRALRKTGVLEDITDRLALQAQLRQSQKMEAVGQLAGGIAHDFNNLLTVIHGYTSLLIDRSPDAAVGRDLGEILRAADRAAALTRQLLAFSRSQVLEPRVLRLSAVAEEALPMLRRLVPENINIRCVTRENGHTLIDAGQMLQVIMNLAVNARDAMPLGGMLTIETSDIVIDDDYVRHHAFGQSGPHVLLAVSDTGHGMDAATQARIFEPFFTTKGLGKGTGLGLAVVYGIVKQSGGYIHVYSEVERGTTFKLYFPTTNAAIQPAPAPEQVTEIPAPVTETVLVVEDEPALQAFIAIVLRRQGYTVEAFSDTQEALNFIHANPDSFDFLLTDIVLPNINGRGMADAVRRVNPNCKVLFMSGYTNDVIVHNGVLESNVNFIQKPFTPASLLRKVRAILDGGASGDTN